MIVFLSHVFDHLHTRGPTVLYRHFHRHDLFHFLGQFLVNLEDVHAYVHLPAMSAIPRNGSEPPLFADVNEDGPL